MASKAPDGSPDPEDGSPEPADEALEPADGSPVPGLITDFGVWAHQKDRRFRVDRGSGTSDLVTLRTYMIRYRLDVVAAFTDGRLSVVVDGRRYQVESVAEMGRRKWLDVSVYFGSV